MVSMNKCRGREGGAFGNMKGWKNILRVVRGRRGEHLGSGWGRGGGEGSRALSSGASRSLSAESRGDRQARRTQQPASRNVSHSLLVTPQVPRLQPTPLLIHMRQKQIQKHFKKHTRAKHKENLVLHASTKVKSKLHCNLFP